jgi:hypothetical protein
MYTFASIINKQSYKNYVTENYYPTNRPIQNTYSFDMLKEKPSVEPTEYIILHSSPPSPPFRIENNTCICKIERNNDSNILIIATSITSSLCVSFFLLLIWYRFIFKKRLLKWKKNEENFGFGPEVI